MSDVSAQCYCCARACHPAKEALCSERARFRVCEGCSNWLHRNAYWRALSQ